MPLSMASGPRRYMLFEVKYELKNDIQKKTRRTQVIVESKEFVKPAFRAQMEDPDNCRIMGIRDMSGDNITLEVQDVTITPKGNI